MCPKCHEESLGRSNQHQNNHQAKRRQAFRGLADRVRQEFEIWDHVEILEDFQPGQDGVERIQIVLDAITPRVDGEVDMRGESSRLIQLLQMTLESRDVVRQCLIFSLHAKQRNIDCERRLARHAARGIHLPSVGRRMWPLHAVCAVCTWTRK
jgi:hypothetical protein